MQKPTLEVVQQRYPRLALCMLVWLLFACTNVQAAETLLLLSDKTQVYQEVAEVITSNTPDRELAQADISDITDQPGLLKQSKLIIAIGSAAAEHALQFSPDGSTVLSTFIPAARYQKLLHTYQNELSLRRIRTSAVYLDQPVSRLMHLAQLIKPDLKSLGFTVGDDSTATLNSLQAEARSSGIRLNYSTLTEADNPIQKIQPVIQQSDLFLVLPDRNIFNKTTAKWLLYMSFRNHVPLIAFSQNYVHAGAIAACISTPRDIARFTVEQLRLINDNYLPAAQYSPYFRVITNPRAARKLKITIQTADTLQQQLLEVE